ncbi:gamma-glutamyl kinase [Aquicoccus porphyridii]|uniref:Gamma-glutamyl kinase n=1 Tax=Aquicoccus porphyridii TaxID=1852029 RepID=A0A5A9ZUV8_9RHOB|nr:gamma-glutamyl kinase [Aquicoccus porphyridii]KAA0920712.1 gamma-glutamyl kinase [Aquicoccus porphyridii]RAI56737.1 gamma-glutamyl kinase [Rhodobacteraceae bacterium AsT-22]
MLIFSKARLVVLSVPKTGTTAIEQALAGHASIAVLDPPELKHAPVYRYNRFFRPMVEKFIGPDMEIIAVMREPLSWLGSWYRYRQRPFLGGTPVSTAEMSFADFIEGYLQDPCPAFANVGSQAKFLEPRPNGTSVDRIFRYEALDECVAYLEDRLNLEIALPRVNVSPDAALSLPDSLKTRLADTCAEDFALWSSLA